LFDIERGINGMSVDERLERRQQEGRPFVDKLEAWMRAERAKLSRSSPVAEAMDYILKRWFGFTTFLDDGRICLTNNAAERALRGFAGQKVVAVCRFRPRCGPGRVHGNADHERQAQRHRSASLAG